MSDSTCDVDGDDGSVGTLLIVAYVLYWLIMIEL